MKTNNNNEVFESLKNIVAGIESVDTGVIKPATEEEELSNAITAEILMMNAVAGIESDETVKHELFENIAPGEHAIGVLAPYIAVATEEDGTINFNSIENYGTEAIGEKIAQVGYKGKAFGQRIIDSIISAYRTLVLHITNRNLNLKKNKTIIKKYEKMLEERIDTNIKDDDDKEHETRTFDKMKDVLDAVKSVTKSNIDTVISNVKGSSTTKSKQSEQMIELSAQLVSGLSALSVVTASKVPAFKGATEIETAMGKLKAGANNVDLEAGVEAVKEILNDNAWKEAAKEFEESIDYKEKKEHKSLSEVKTYLLKHLKATKDELDQDLSLKAKMIKFLDTVKKERDKIMKDSPAADQANDNQLGAVNSLVGLTPRLLAAIQTSNATVYKLADSMMQALITDAYATATKLNKVK